MADGQSSAMPDGEREQRTTEPLVRRAKPRDAAVAEARQERRSPRARGLRHQAGAGTTGEQVAQGGAALALHPASFAIQLFYDEAVTAVDEFTLTVDGTKVLRLDDGNTSRLESRYLNQIANSDFTDPHAVGWRYRTAEGAFRRVGVNFSPDTTLENAATAYAFLEDAQRAITLEYAETAETERRFVVQPGERLCFSGLFATHRCTARLLVCFADDADRSVGEQAAGVSENVPGGRRIEGYEHAALMIEAPKGAAAAVVRIAAELTAGSSNGFLFFTRLWFGRMRAAAPASWSPAPADLFGADKAARLAGHVCRSIDLPQDCLDGRPHVITVSRSSGRPIDGSPLTVLRQRQVGGEITEVAGGSVLARLSVDSAAAPEPVVELLIDGEPAGSATAHGDGPTRIVALPIPHRFCDGRPHVFAVRLRDSGAVFARMPALAPTALTTFDALLTYAGLPIDASLSPLARSRYRALLDNLGAKRAGIDLKWLHDRLLRGPVAEARYERLTLPRPADPTVSIVIPAKDHFDMTYLCLCALLFSYNEASWEVIVVDDGSSDETAAIESMIDGVQVVRHAATSGFVRSCNDGARAASGEYVVLLNNDTEPASRWLDEMLYAFRRFPKVGLVGAKLLYPDGALQEAGGIVWKNGNPWNYGRRANPAAPQYCYSRQVDYVSGAALMVPRRVWQEVGGLSEEFAPAYFEDTDLAFKIRQRGLKTVFAPLAVVHHYEGVSSGTDPGRATKRFQEVNRPKFKRKWLSACRNNGSEGVDVDIAKDRGVPMRALMIDFEVPRLDFDAGSYAAIQEMRALQALGFKITFVPTNFAYLGRHTERLQRMGVETLYAPFASSVDGILAGRGAEFDIVYVTRYQVAQQVAESVRRHAPNAKFVVNMADLHFLRELRSALERGDRAAAVQALQTRDAELAALRQADLVMSYSPIEQGVVLSHNLETPKLALLPWIAESRPLIVPFAERRNVAFLGGFRHAPNVEAVEFFLERVLPGLSAELPGVTFEIYGSAISADNRRNWARGNVAVHGAIPDLGALFDRTRVFVAPLLSGGGIKGKVFDCLSCGVPSVISPVAAEGIGLRDGLETLLAATPEDWVPKIKLLYTDETLWNKISVAAQQFVDNYHSFARGVEVMRRGLEKVGLFCEPADAYLVSNTCRP